MRTKKAGAALPVDTAQWGELMQSDLVNRMPRIAPLIKTFKLLNSDEQGNGTGLFFLEGERVYVPVIAKEWKILPIDTLVYKSDNKTVMAYLCERNILKFMTSASFGRSPGSRGSKTQYDSQINLFSPSGGYGDRTANPFSPNFGGRSKTASVLDQMAEDLEYTQLPYNPDGADFAVGELGKTNIFNTFPELQQYVDTVLCNEDRGSFSLLERDEDSYTVFDVESPEGRQVDEADVKAFLKTLPPEERQTKTASILCGSGITSFGPVAASKQFKYLDPTSGYQTGTGEKQKSVTQEGIYYVGNSVGYVNPNLIFVDGTPAHKSLVVTAGSCSIQGSSLNSWIDSTNSVESGQLSKDILVPIVKKIRAGDLITIYNRRTKQTTVPLEVVLPTEDRQGVVKSFVVKPLSGNPETVTIKWYNGIAIKDNGSEVLYPVLESEVYALSSFESEDSDSGFGFGVPSFNRGEKEEMVAEFARGGGDIISIKEKGQYIKTCQSRGEFLYFAIKRYGLGKKQAIELTRKVVREKQVAIVLEMRNFHTKQNNLDHRVKEAITRTIQFAGRLNKFAAAGAPEAKGGAPGEGGVATSAQGQENPDQAENAKGALTQQSLTQTKTISRQAQEVVELLTYYSLGNIRKEELNSVFSEVQSQLEEIENSLSKILLLSQLGKVQGVDYSETKMMLSDIDNYLARVSSSKALGELA